MFRLKFNLKSKQKTNLITKFYSSQNLEKNSRFELVTLELKKHKIKEINFVFIQTNKLRISEIGYK